MQHSYLSESSEGLSEQRSLSASTSQQRARGAKRKQKGSRVTKETLKTHLHKGVPTNSYSSPHNLEPDPLGMAGLEAGKVTLHC